MNTNVLIPKNLKIKVRTWNDLVFLGKENLIAIRAIWRSRESELGERIKWLQKTADFLAGGPNNVEAMTIVEKRKDRADFDCLGLFRGKKRDARNDEISGDPWSASQRACLLRDPRSGPHAAPNGEYENTSRQSGGTDRTGRFHSLSLLG